METGRRLEATLHPVVRAAYGPAPSAATAMAGRPRAIRRAEAPASAAKQRMAAEQPVAEEERMVAEELTAAGVINRSVIRFRVV